MQRWFKKGEKVTAEAARRITGISSPFGGIQWGDPGPSTAEIIRQFVVFLRRVLYNSMDLEVTRKVERSIREIREQCTKTLQALPLKAFAVPPIRIIRSAARRFHDEQNEDFRFFHDAPWDHRRGSPGFFVALGAFRATVGQQVALLAAHYDIDVEGDLASALPQLDEDATQT
jgi:hypothetical protein